MPKHLITSLLAGVMAATALTFPLGPVRAAEPAVRVAPVKVKDNFYLKDGDRVVFYGDSITDQRQYTTYIESFCVSRFPDRHFTFVHSGWGGDRVTGGGGGPIDLRVKRDVLAYNPTVVTICLGMNDGGYRAFDQGLYDTYVNGLRHILDTLKKELPGVRVTLLTAPAYDDVTRDPKFEGGYNAVLKRYGDAVVQLGKEYNYTVADTNAPLVATLEKGKTSNLELASKLIPDRVHPGHGGHLVMAAAVLKAWNAPDTVANIVLDAAHHKTERQDNTKLSDIKYTKTGITFTELDKALPWPLDRDPERDKDTQLALASTDYEMSLNRYMLQVKGLPAGTYQMTVDGMDVRHLSAEDLSMGVDLAAIDALPSNIQAREILTLTRKHNDIHFKRWRQVQVPAAKDGLDVPADVKKQMDDLDTQDAAAVTNLASAVTPTAHKVSLALIQP